MKNIISIIFGLLLFSPLLNAGEVKLRAREHYEILEIKQNNNSVKYQGFNNTINLWWEKPYDFSIGLSYSPVISTLKEKEDDSYLGKKIKVINFGVEAKIFERDLFNYFYLRPGVTYTILKSDNLRSNKTGISTYLGLGYEFPFKKFGLALEFAYRFSQVEDDFTIDTITPSIGFHLYEFM